jgi:uncharacterized protein YutE (UPF0331/DUF86 family)
MTDAGLVLDKLRRLRDGVALVRERRPSSPDTLRTDPVLRDALAMSLLVTVQQVADIAYHIAADEGWGVPDSHAEALDLLASHGVMSADLAVRIADVVRVRNRLAHGYASVDHERLWQELPEGLVHLEVFARAVAAWLPPEG